MAQVRTATVLHADLDAFYASVEQLLNPSLRQRPIAVGGGVVLAASYEARLSECEPAWWGGGRNSCVRACSSSAATSGSTNALAIRSSTCSATSLRLSSGSRSTRRSSMSAELVHLFGSPSDIAAAIRRRVRNEIGLGISVGVARTKHLAKVASQAAKPDGLVVVEPNDETTFLNPLPVEMLWGVGPATRTRLDGSRIRTIGDLAALRVHSSSAARQRGRQKAHIAGQRIDPAASSPPAVRSRSAPQPHWGGKWPLPS